MSKRLMIFLMLLIFFNQTAVASLANKCNDQIILGAAEKILLIENNILINAKLDTGAQMSSLSATDIKLYKKHGNSFVQFNILDSQHHQKITITKPLIGFVNIRKREEEKSNRHSFAIRPVVNFTVCIANQKQQLSMNLVNRSSFHYAMLIGSDALKHLNAVVDVNKAFQFSPTCS